MCHRDVQSVCIFRIFFQEMQNPTISVIADEETLCTFCERALSNYPGKIITIVVLGLEKYFRCVIMCGYTFYYEVSYASAV